MKLIIKKIARLSIGTVWYTFKIKFNQLMYPKLAKILSEKYFKESNRFIVSLIDRINNGENVEAVLKGFDGTKFTERIVEYTYFASWIKDVKSDTILDVGSVLNNDNVNMLLKEKFKSIWFCNVASESIVLDTPVYYHISSLNNAFPQNEKFPLVTCLSTIEHIGYDNSQYGSFIPAIYDTPQQKPLHELIKKLLKLVEKNGKLLISCPYGFREVLIHPATLKKASQVFDYESVKIEIEFLKENGFDVDFSVFQSFKEGWLKVDPTKCNAKYADNCPAAQAVSIISATKID